MKKGLGRIPKSLSWIDSIDESHAEVVQPAPENRRESAAVSSKAKKQLANKVQHQPVMIQKNMAVKIEEEPAVSTVSTCQNGLPAGWTRATYIVDKELNESIKAVAYWERLTVKEVIHDALTQYMQGKNVKPIPKKKNAL